MRMLMRTQSDPDEGTMIDVFETLASAYECYDDLMFMQFASPLAKPLDTADEEEPPLYEELNSVQTA